MIQVLGEQMEEDFARWCCMCCAQPVDPETRFIYEGRVYCNEEHLIVDTEYRRLCKEAKAQAALHDKPEKKGEIDYKHAQRYLEGKLQEFREARASISA